MAFIAPFGLDYQPPTYLFYHFSDIVIRVYRHLTFEYAFSASFSEENDIYSSPYVHF